MSPYQNLCNIIHGVVRAQGLAIPICNVISTQHIEPPATSPPYDPRPPSRVTITVVSKKWLPLIARGNCTDICFPALGNTSVLFVM